MGFDRKTFSDIIMSIRVPVKISEMGVWVSAAKVTNASELYNLIEDPLENHNLAEERPDVVAHLRACMEGWIARRTAETGLQNPILTQGNWHGIKGLGPFKSSQDAYDWLRVGAPHQAPRLQAPEKSEAEEAKP